MNESEELLSECLADYRARRGAGESIPPVEYASKLGADYEQFAQAAEAEDLIDDLIEAPAAQELPRRFGAFTLIRELGRGAGGVVFEAEQTSLKRKVALKLLRDGFEHDPLAREHFLREAGICAQLKHPNIVDIYEAGEVDGIPFFAMEIVEGSTLGEWMQSHDRPNVMTLCEHLAEVADALEQLHQRGIVHRDIKPSNIMATHDGKLLLTDFGMARTELGETLARTGVALGTPLYMSPEQLLGKRHEVDGRSDVYGLGATLFECLSGQAPFVTDDSNALVRMILNERPPGPSTIAPCPPDADRIALKCLEKEQGDRYASAAEMRDDLRRLARGEPVLGRPLGATTRVMRAVVHRPRMSLAAAAALVIALAAGWFVMNRSATFNADILPDGKVKIAVVGEPLGDAMTAPLRDHELAPGRYRFVFESRGFHTLVEEDVDVGPGQKLERAVKLKVKDPSDPDVLERVCRAMGIERASYARPPRGLQRSGVEPVDAYPLWPRGRVRIEDLAEFTACIGVDYDPEHAELVIKIGDEVVHRDREFDPDDMVATVSVPEHVAERLRGGPRFSWGFKLGDNKQTWAECELVRSDLGSKLALLEAMLPSTDIDPGSEADRARHLLTARALHEAGLYTAAWRELDDALREGARDRHQHQALLIRYDCLRNAAGPALADLRTTTPFVQIEQALRAKGWPDSDRGR